MTLMLVKKILFCLSSFGSAIRFALAVRFPIIYRHNLHLLYLQARTHARETRARARAIVTIISFISQINSTKRHTHQKYTDSSA